MGTAGRAPRPAPLEESRGCGDSIAKKASGHAWLRQAWPRRSRAVRAPTRRPACPVFSRPPREPGAAFPPWAPGQSPRDQGAAFSLATSRRPFARTLTTCPGKLAPGPALGLLPWAFPAGYQAPRGQCGPGGRDHMLLRQGHRAGARLKGGPLSPASLPPGLAWPPPRAPPLPAPASPRPRPASSRVWVEGCRTSPPSGRNPVQHCTHSAGCAEVSSGRRRGWEGLPPGAGRGEWPGQVGRAACEGRTPWDRTPWDGQRDTWQEWDISRGQGLLPSRTGRRGFCPIPTARMQGLWAPETDRKSVV